MDKNKPIPSPFSSKKAIQLILFSFSLFSFLFSQSSSLVPNFLFPPSFSNIKLFYYSADRNYIFLLCNGILLVIIKNSGLLANAPPPDNECRDQPIQDIDDDESKDLKNVDDVKKNDQSHVLFETKSQGGIQVVEAETQISSKEEDDENVIRSEVEDEDDQLVLLLSFEKGGGDEFPDIKEKEEENEGGLLSAEELNKKCDDFIRKMKDGIKIEAQHLFMVSFQAQRSLA